MMERFKTLTLIILILSSLLLSYALLSGVGQYDALPMWLTEVPQTDPEDEEPGEVIEPTEIVLPEIVAPERLVEHTSDYKRMYYLTTNDYAFNVWQEVDKKINSSMLVEVESVSSSQWNSAVNNGSWEFILSGAYPIEVLFPFWHDGTDSYSTKIERLLVTNEQTPRIFARMVSGDDYYKLNLSDSSLTGSVFSLLNSGNKGEYYEVFDVGVNNEDITAGVYLAENFLGRYNNLFPEIWVAPERYSTSRWLPKFFSNPSLAREISLGEDKSQFSIGTTSVTLDYAGFPHLDYSYSILDDEPLNEDINYFEAVDISSMFLADHEISNWIDFKRAIRITSASVDNSTKYSFDYRNYADALDVGIPILSSDPAFKVTNNGGIVTNMTRHIWQYSRFNYVPKIEIDGADAIERLSKDEHKIEVWWNPYAEEVISSFQDYINRGYYISDVHLAYYVPDNLFSGAFISPYWTVVLANGRENKVRFFINAMTRYLPRQNGLEFR